MKIVINESQLEMMINESFRFNWRDANYSWVNDKKNRNTNTSMTTRDENNKLKYGYIDFTLPKSKITSHNLFNIKSFYVTQSLKHNKVNRYLPGDDKDYPEQTQKIYHLSPDKSIEDFKKYVAKYILKICLNKGYYVDVVLTPESSSEFNSGIANIIKVLFEKTFNKQVIVKPNSFIKTPENIIIDKNALQKNVEFDLKNQLSKSNVSPDVFIEYVNLEIRRLYKKVHIWKVESEISVLVNQIYRLQKILDDIISSRMWEKTKKEYLEDINDDFEWFIGRIRDMVGNDYKKTKYFTSQGKLRPFEETLNSFQIKSLNDSFRKSISHLFSLTKEYDKKYSYTNKNKENVSGVSTFIDRLSRNDKTILIFDDNLSSGATLDDTCMTLINGGIKRENIVVFTLGKVKESNFYMRAQSPQDEV